MLTNRFLYYFVTSAWILLNRGSVSKCRVNFPNFSYDVHIVLFRCSPLYTVHLHFPFSHLSPIPFSSQLSHLTVIDVSIISPNIVHIYLISPSI